MSFYCSYLLFKKNHKEDSHTHKQTQTCSRRVSTFSLSLSFTLFSPVLQTHSSTAASTETVKGLFTAVWLQLSRVPHESTLTAAEIFAALFPQLLWFCCFLLFFYLLFLFCFTPLLSLLCRFYIVSVSYLLPVFHQCLCLHFSFDGNPAAHCKFLYLYVFNSAHITPHVRF